MTRLECHVASAGLHEAMVGFFTAAVSGGGGGQLVLAYMLRHMRKPYAMHALYYYASMYRLTQCQPSVSDNPTHRRRSLHSQSSVCVCVVVP